MGAGVEEFVKGEHPTPLFFRYTNHAGETSDRQVTDPRVAFGTSVFHPECGPEWFLIGNDAARGGEVRHFLLSRMLPPPELAQLIYGAERSGRWRKVREEFLKDHPVCAACGTRGFLNVHHISPFHLDPSLELDPANLITLCETPSHNDHLLLGHLLDWKAYNPDVRADAAVVLAKINSRRYHAPGPGIL